MTQLTVQRIAPSSHRPTHAPYPIPRRLSHELEDNIRSNTRPRYKRLYSADKPRRRAHSAQLLSISTYTNPLESLRKRHCPLADNTVSARSAREGGTLHAWFPGYDMHGQRIDTTRGIIASSHCCPTSQLHQKIRKATNANEHAIRELLASLRLASRLQVAQTHTISSGCNERHFPLAQRTCSTASYPLYITALHNTVRLALKDP